MDEKEPIKIKLSTVILLFIILILLLIIICTYFYFTNWQKTKTQEIESIANHNINTTNTKTIETSQEVQNTPITVTPKNLNIESDEIQKLYKYIMKINTNQEQLVYQDTKITQKDLNNQLKLITVFENLTEKEANHTQTITDEYNVATKHTYYTKDTVEKIAKRIFGNDVTLTHESCEANFTNAIDYQNNTYDCYEYQGGGNTPWELSTFELVRAEQMDNEIYLYDNYAHIYGEVESTTYDIYDTSNKHLKIAESIHLDEIMDSSTEKIMMSKIEKITNQKIKTFKHTFKKNSDGSYYWYSTEPIK